MYKKPIIFPLNETRFSEDDILFNEQDIYDKAQDALFYIDRIKANVFKLPDLPKNFKFDLAFEKLTTAVQKIANSTGIENPE